MATNDPMENERPPEIRQSGVNWQLPAVAKIEGIQLQPDQFAALSEVAIQYGSSQTRRWCEVRMPIAEAFRLAAFLDQMRADPRVAAILNGKKS